MSLMRGVIDSCQNANTRLNGLCSRGNYAINEQKLYYANAYGVILIATCSMEAEGYFHHFLWIYASAGGRVILMREAGAMMHFLQVATEGGSASTFAVVWDWLALHCSEAPPRFYFRDYKNKTLNTRLKR
ncbi:hypothetical protein AV530_002566 [Patagioenas fasciata monilis]|uniref:Uncharacterized protein n=1 Tax=Patagioenas fasciata monilis TaxID=372326 RepID=A0A1V4K6Y9_PATFA|nr:hypothetical protein AV530_002566 [Patagioenas fasciata monilis]